MTSRIADVGNQLKEDVCTLYNYFTGPSTPANQVDRPDQLLNESAVESEDPQTLLQKRAYGAAYRVFGGVFMVAGAILIAKVILPIITFKFCVTVAIAVAAYVVGHDVFVMAKKREELQLPEATSYQTYLLSLFSKGAIDEASYAELTRGTYWAAYTKLVSTTPQQQPKSSSN